MSRSEEIRNAIPDEYEKTEGYLLWDFSESVGQVLDEVDSDIAEASRKLNIDNLTGDELNKFISQRKGIERKAATKAIGSLTVTGNGTVAVGDLFETENGVQFEAVETVAIADSGTVNIQSVIPGNVGVVGSGSITEMPVTIEGIATCSNTEPTAEGYDEESDESLRDRYYAALKTPATSGNKFHYMQWAREVEGVGGAEVFPLGHGDNTVDVVIIDDAKKPASSSLVSKVQNYIDPNSEGKGNGMAPIGAKCYVAAAEGLVINLSVKLTLLSGAVLSEVKTNLETNLTSYFATLAFNANVVSYAQIGNQILDTRGVLDYENLTVNNGTSNVTIPAKNVPVLGTVTYA